MEKGGKQSLTDKHTARSTIIPWLKVVPPDSITLEYNSSLTPSSHERRALFNSLSIPNPSCPKDDKRTLSIIKEHFN